MPFSIIDSPIGEVVVSGDQRGLTGLAFADSRDGLVLRGAFARDDGAFDPVAEQLRAYFAGQLTRFELPLAPSGTEFQRRVWAGVREIPFGTTSTYGRLAAQLGHPSAVRALGHANGRNPIAIIIPCHRLVGSDGRLTGYGGGLDRKRWLIAHERKWHTGCGAGAHGSAHDMETAHPAWRA